MNISKDIKYIGVNDHQVDLFEGQYLVPNGMSYNSYIILDEKIAIMDTVDLGFTEEWLHNVEVELKGKKPDYLIIQHMEPDHSANIVNFLNRYSETKVVSSLKSFGMMKNFFGQDFVNKIIVGDKDTLSLGKHNLTFVTAPMVHWPEVIMTYDNYDKVLFTADGFGKFGALDIDEEWIDEARRYYIGIVGKYGIQVQNVLKKASNLDINQICPLHGPVLNDNLNYYLNLYDTWSSYKSEQDGVLIAYTSIYGNTKKAVMLLEEQLKKDGYNNVEVVDLAREDMAHAISLAFKYSKLVVASPTYNNDVFPPMHSFLHGLVERNYSNRTVALIQNGSWAPQAANVMKNMLEKCKNLLFIDNIVTINSALSDKNRAEISELSKKLI